MREDDGMGRQKTEKRKEEKMRTTPAQYIRLARASPNGSTNSRREEREPDGHHERARAHQEPRAEVQGARDAAGEREEAQREAQHEDARGHAERPRHPHEEVDGRRRHQGRRREEQLQVRPRVPREQVRRGQRGLADDGRRLVPPRAPGARPRQAAPREQRTARKGRRPLRVHRKQDGRPEIEGLRGPLPRGRGRGDRVRREHVGGLRIAYQQDELMFFFNKLKPILMF